MKKFLSLLAVVFSLGLASLSMEAEAAKRMGAGKSVGTQRESVQNKAPAAPAAQASPSAAPAAGAAAASKPSWAGPLAGLAAGLGIAALASHFGFGDELASMMMMGLLAFTVMALIGFVLRRRAQTQKSEGQMPPGLVPASIGSGAPHADNAQAPQAQNTYKVSMPSSASATSAGSGSLIGSALQPTGSTVSVPADFDQAGFERHAKSNFIRLQAAYDSGVVDDLRDFTSPEMLAQLKQELSERGAASQRGEVLQLNAKVLEVVQEPQGYLVSVQFTGFIRYGAGIDDEVFDEVWHLSKPLTGQGGWVVAGIQQLD
ncbi:Tim44-like domain-containing protein [Curvibacter sp. RS43]|uniref:Tim44 domain-containing protein n=1 Tax=Curvibacter microcysteis TaxID=3026419 RepID=UPI00235E6709|nr:Tim44-like domain-containing protein [Curvibacter sp. RS43]MDD0809576.1 Tim44-like domain-containing protein [Curvibacter sp. RS43]